MPLEIRKSGRVAKAAQPDGDAGSLAASNVLRLHFAGEDRGNCAPQHLRQKDHDFTLTASETRRLLGICIELIDLCSKVTGRIDPAVGKVVAYARDEAMDDAYEMT
jgi:hypothetical protein